MVNLDSETPEVKDSKLLRISYILTKKEWAELCKAKWTPFSVMDIMGIRPKEFQVEEVYKTPEDL